MRNFTRWTVFTAAIALAWLAGGFLYLILSRLYSALQLPTLMLLALCAMAGATAVAAIAFATKLDEEDGPTTARRARTAPARRPQR